MDRRLTGAVSQVPPGWPDSRVKAFGPRDPSKIRVVSFNILAVPYARTQLATQIMYPYCPSQVLDYAYRQPLIGDSMESFSPELVKQANLEELKARVTGTELTQEEEMEILMPKEHPLQVDRLQLAHFILEAKSKHLEPGKIWDQCLLFVVRGKRSDC
eukprot:Skav216117  [mRNA]  locus=scaffold1946:174187:184630:+ [translate_table: standard]